MSTLTVVLQSSFKVVEHLLDCVWAGMLHKRLQWGTTVRYHSEVPQWEWGTPVRYPSEVPQWGTTVGYHSGVPQWGTTVGYHSGVPQWGTTEY